MEYELLIDWKKAYVNQLYIEEIINQSLNTRTDKLIIKDDYNVLLANRNLITYKDRASMILEKLEPEEITALAYLATKYRNDEVSIIGYYPDRGVLAFKSLDYLIGHGKIVLLTER